MSRSANVDRLNRMNDTAQTSFLVNPHRWKNVSLAAWFAEQGNMSFNAFTSNRRMTVAGMLPCVREGYIAVGSIIMQNDCIKHYVSAVNGFREELEEVRPAHFYVSFVSANIDMFRNKITKRKYFCMRLHFVEPTSGVMTSFNAGICEFTLSYLERANIRASIPLVDFFFGLCLTIGLQQSVVLTVSGEHGSDVAQAIVISAQDMAERCVSH